jgi:hypothetical protein
MDHRAKPQWIMSISIYHGPTFGHSVELDTVSKRPMEDTSDVIGSWHGIGVPEEVYKQILASVQAVLSDHLVYRYGVQPALKDDWGSEVSPF